ncbi:NAD-dependent epimerase/dehydratase family protein [Myceligenerans salitolerans]|uniref:NAD-dependent epimerase/dehydratase family protein n=1 Tax=Myceligenerans salitolerans TaxID=1230528 RepID=A0ABS3I9H4_9MICO|nr:NAD-dependent epimerase/dehydratase family protein [Myceligenerans salitolerans]MBO0609014.1 NAD-dependent epimerase/dehydratase family protein [Myceligenerans salitolerans]
MSSQTYFPRVSVTRAVVTGGAGFVGSRLCEALVDSGAEVVCVDNLLTGAIENLGALRGRGALRFVRSDIAEDGFTSPAVRAALRPGVDLVMHLASPASPVDYLEHPLETLDVGSRGTRAALDLAQEHGARLVLASTSEVYGDPQVHPQREEYWGNVSSVGPRSVYDESKRFAEALVSGYRRTLGTDTGIVRIFNTYGPRMREHDGRVVPTFIRQALAGEPLTVAGDGSQTRSLCYVDDMVAGLLAFARSGHPGPMNLGNPHELTVRRIAEDVIDATGSRSRIDHIERPVDDPGMRCPDITLARTELGWEPGVTWPDGLSRTVGWFRRRGQEAA